ncbi:hypothetical protein [uncultured Agrobacterium sp.]|uniref:hypothetical protein n=2 Tax=uncultured Agrobacterium sp. TaxID=157277 RepID=UPI0025EA1603|nr:hypothetical protein [uncultured Agrobacterium sp.]
MTEAEAYEVAHHEAAHCVMSIMKNCLVRRIEVYDPPKDGAQGVCVHQACDHWQDEVWICLAGPIADSIRTGKAEHHHYNFGGSADFDKAEKAICDWLLPAVPAELVPVIGADPLKYLDAVWGQWEAPVRGQQKRKLTLYTKKLLRAHQFALEILHGEARMVRAFLLETPGILDAIEFLATRLTEKRRLETSEIIDLLNDVWNAPRYRMAA